MIAQPRTRAAARQAPTCEFALLTAPPAEPHQSSAPFIQYDKPGFLDKPEQLKRKIRPEVCKVGGDAPEGHANSYGTYTKVTVYALEVAPPPAPAASAAPSAEASSAGDASEGDPLPLDP